MTGIVQATASATNQASAALANNRGEHRAQQRHHDLQRRQVIHEVDRLAHSAWSSRSTTSMISSSSMVP